MLRKLFEMAFGKGSTMPMTKRKLLLVLSATGLLGYIMGTMLHSEIVHFFLGN